MCQAVLACSAGSGPLFRPLRARSLCSLQVSERTLSSFELPLRFDGLTGS